MKNSLAVFAGAVIAFVWSSISWMVIPWHQPTMKGFENEEAIGQTIKAASPAPGIYTYPAWTDDEGDMQKKHEAGPYVFASVVPAGVGSEMTSMMIGGFLANLVGAAILLNIILLVPGQGWKLRALLATMAGLFVSLVPALMNLNWWHFPFPFTVVSIADSFISWTAAGIVMSMMTARKAVK